MIRPTFLQLIFIFHVGRLFEIFEEAHNVFADRRKVYGLLIKKVRLGGSVLLRKGV